LQSEETQKVLRLFDRQKAKSRGWRGLISRSNPCFELISLAFAVFCP